MKIISTAALALALVCGSLAKAEPINLSDVLDQLGLNGLPSAEPTPEQLEALKQQHIKQNTILLKVVGGYGLKPKHSHPSTRCEVSSSSLSLVDHDLDEEKWEVTTKRSQVIKLKKESADDPAIELDYDEVVKMVKEAHAEKLETVKDFNREYEPSVFYGAIIPVEKEVVGPEGKKQKGLQAEPVILYLLDRDERVRQGESSEKLVDLLDTLCTNDKSIEELKPSVRR